MDLEADACVSYLDSSQLVCTEPVQSCSIALQSVIVHVAYTVTFTGFLPLLVLVQGVDLEYKEIVCVLVLKIR